MKTFKERIIPAQTVTDLEAIKCDICGKVTDKLTSNSSEIKEVTIQLQTGHHFHDGGSSGQNISIDLCPECFKDKLIPWVQSQGGEPSVNRWLI